MCIRTKSVLTNDIIVSKDYVYTFLAENVGSLVYKSYVLSSPPRTPPRDKDTAVYCSVSFPLNFLFLFLFYFFLKKSCFPIAMANTSRTCTPDNINPATFFQQVCNTTQVLHKTKMPGKPHIRRYNQDKQPLQQHSAVCQK